MQRISKRFEQITIMSVIEQKQKDEKPYFNGMGEPLPWEENKVTKSGNKEIDRSESIQGSLVRLNSNNI